MASIQEDSLVSHEAEVMLSVGIILRTKSVEEIHENKKYSVKIEMICGNEERKMENDLRQFHLYTPTAFATQNQFMSLLILPLQRFD